MPRAVAGWVLAGVIAAAILPWHNLDDWIFGPAWLAKYPGGWSGPALYQTMRLGHLWLAPALVPIAMLAVLALGPVELRRRIGTGTHVSLALIWFSVLGLVLMAAQGFAVIHSGVAWVWLTPVLPADVKQPGMGLGALLLGLSYLMLMAAGWAQRGACRGDFFTVGAISLVCGLLVLFVLFPLLIVMASAFHDDRGNWAPAIFFAKALDPSIWGLGCFRGTSTCGVAWNTVILGVVVGLGSTFIGLAFALVAARTNFRFKPALNALTVLPVITPPFVIGLAVILLFGRAGAVTGLMADYFGIPRSRWVYGFTGVSLAQMLAFAPIAFMVLIGVIQGISPSLEEASQTLRASPWITFRTVTWPLARPGIANAFLLGFVESAADFGTPLVLGGNFEVLSTKIFFSVVGAAHDQGRAAVLGIVLLGFVLIAFWGQQIWQADRAYTTVTGKGDGGLSMPLPRGVKWLAYGTALPWALLTAIIYATVFLGAFVKSIGRDHTPTLEHFGTGFSIEYGARGLHFTGSAWDSFFTTLEIAIIAAPLTAAIGLLTAYLIMRQDFRGKKLFEFTTLLSAAIPGTVVGVSYILAYNVPPIELTGTAAILVICFVFRNMLVGVRTGMATLSQIDRSLDEASTTLGALPLTTIRRVVLPLIKPAIVSSLVYSFVRAITGVSAVIFLVTAQYNMATAYIIGRADAGEYGLAIAYSTVLIAVMLIAILGIQLFVGERKLGRRGAQATPATAGLAG